MKKIRVGSTIAAVGTRVLDLLLPVNCVVCNTEGHYLCCVKAASRTNTAKPTLLLPVR